MVFFGLIAQNATLTTGCLVTFVKVTGDNSVLYIHFSECISLYCFTTSFMDYCQMLARFRELKFATVNCFIMIFRLSTFSAVGQSYCNKVNDR